MIQIQSPVKINMSTPVRESYVYDGNHGASRVALKGKLMPIKLRLNLVSQDEADAFKCAADCGTNAFFVVGQL